MSDYGSKPHDYDWHYFYMLSRAFTWLILDARVRRSGLPPEYARPLAVQDFVERGIDSYYNTKGD